MALTWLFRAHGVSSIPFALALLASPRWVVDLLAPGSLSPAGVVFGRLYGLMLAFLVVVTLAAAASRLGPARIAAAKGLLALEVAGVALALAAFPSDAKWALAKWSSVALYAVFALGYAWILLIAPQRARLPYERPAAALSR